MAPVTFMAEHDEEPMSRTFQYRKVMKPLLERKRRARINSCLDELKDLMVSALHTEGETSANAGTEPRPGLGQISRRIHSLCYRSEPLSGLSFRCRHHSRNKTHVSSRTETQHHRDCQSFSPHCQCTSTQGTGLPQDSDITIFGRRILFRKRRITFTFGICFTWTSSDQPKIAAAI